MAPIVEASRFATGATRRGPAPPLTRTVPSLTSALDDGPGSATPLVGLVRMLDRRGWRHSYAAGKVPTDGVLVGELGSLHSCAGPETEPVWIIDGRLVTERCRPLLPESGMLAALRWALAPVAWHDFATAPGRRRTILSRLVRMRRYRRQRNTGIPSAAGSPAGWIGRQDGPFSHALWAAVHPVTGDQLLTANRWEAIDLGYQAVVLVGFLHWVTPLTGSPVSARPLLPWASRLGQCVRTDTGPPEYEARGQIDGPDGPISLPWRIRGWALAPDTTVSSIELIVGEESIGRARIGLARPAIAASTPHPDGPVCGWEHTIMPADVPADRLSTSVAATIRTLDGRRLWLGPVPLQLASPTPNLPQHRAARLRQRARSLAQPPAPTSGPTRVLVFTHSLQLGGAQLYLQELLTRLTASTDLAFSIVAPEDGPLRDSLEALGIPVHITHFYPVASVETYEAKLAELAAWAERAQFDIVFINTVLAFCGVEVAELLGVPSVFAIHESFDLAALWVEAYEGFVHPYVKHRAAQTLSLASVVLFEAEATRRQYRAYGEDARMLTLPYGIELEQIDRFRAATSRVDARCALDLPIDATVILSLGTIEPRKGQAGLVQAFGNLAERHPDALLMLVGEVPAPWCGPYAAGVRELAVRAGLRDRVVIRPMDPEPYRWHEAADLLVCASDVESLPRVALEAMAFHTPVLATSVFGLPELIDEGRTGWLCDPRDVRSLASALDRVLSADAEHRQRVAATAARGVRVRHAPEAYASRVAQLLAGLVADSGAAPHALLV